MKKYKISESNLSNFWNWFTKKNQPPSLQNVIDNDPELKRLRQDMKDLIDSQIPILLRIKKNRPDHWKIMVQKGLVPADLK
jgi:hypothetical protein